MSDQDQDIELDYGYLAQNALRQVIREALSVTEALGDTPGEHHFYIEFLTTATGVGISPGLQGRYPDRMTIVLQHSFENLEVTDSGFSVILKFGGTPEKLVIPFSAIMSFQDPSAQFSLEFEIFSMPEADAGPDVGPDIGPDIGKDAMEEGRSTSAPRPLASAPPPPGGQADPAGADIVSLDSFRKE